MTLRVIKGICALYPPPKGGGLTAQKVNQLIQSSGMPDFDGGRRSLSENVQARSRFVVRSSRLDIQEGLRLIALFS